MKHMTSKMIGLVVVGMILLLVGGMVSAVGITDLRSGVKISDATFKFDKIFDKGKENNGKGNGVGFGLGEIRGMSSFAKNKDKSVLKNGIKEIKLRILAHKQANLVDNPLKDYSLKELVNKSGLSTSEKQRLLDAIAAARKYNDSPSGEKKEHWSFLLASESDNFFAFGKAKGARVSENGAFAGVFKGMSNLDDKSLAGVFGDGLDLGLAVDHGPDPHQVGELPQQGEVGRSEALGLELVHQLVDLTF